MTFSFNIIVTYLTDILSSKAVPRMRPTSTPKGRMPSNNRYTNKRLARDQKRVT